MSILISYGTRPEYIKVKPLIDEMSRRHIPYKTLFTGQHKDMVSNVANFNIVMSSETNNRLDYIIASCMNLDNMYFEGIKYIIVQGDTTSVVGLALAGLHRKIGVIHLEAGLRTYDNDNPYPEENNRRIVSTLASIHLCPTKNNKENLLRENIDAQKIFVVGNTVLDNLIHLRDKITYENKVLVTLHRRENHENIKNWFVEINKLAEKHPELEFILPLHPNPNVQQYQWLLPFVKVVAPMIHDDLINLLLKAKLVITDSGGIQEECSFLNKTALVCRKVTERPESIGKTSFMIEDPESLALLFEEHINEVPRALSEDSPYGDGRASQKICNILETLG